MLYGDLRLRLIRLQRERAGIQHAEEIAGFHVIAFVNPQFGHAAASFKRQRYLPDVHVAIQGQGLNVATLPHEPPDACGNERDSDNGEGNGLLFHDLFHRKSKF